MYFFANGTQKNYDKTRNFKQNVKKRYKTKKSKNK